MRMKLIFTLLAFGLFLPMTTACEKQKFSGEIKSFEYLESNMRAFPARYYLIERNGEGTLLLKFTEYGPILKVVKAPEHMLLKIDRIVQECRLWNLKHSYVAKHVLDGTMWDVWIRYEEGSISSGGSNKWPSGTLRRGLDEIEAYIHSVTDKVTEEDIINYEPYER